MFYWFFLSTLCLLTALLLHRKSVEHSELRRKLGEGKAASRGRLYGAVSGTMESVALVGLWISPQPRLIMPALSGLAIPIASVQVPLLYLVISMLLIVVGAIFGVGGVREVGLEVAETHCSPNKIVSRGVYSVVRHPQYFGWFLSHVGISLLLSAEYAMFFSPILLALIYLISKKEQDELIREFGEEYKRYMKEIPMLFPDIKRLKV